jgi:hypothetical protein
MQLPWHPMRDKANSYVGRGYWHHSPPCPRWLCFLPRWLQGQGQFNRTVLQTTFTLTYQQFSTQSQGFAFYAVTRPVRAPHPHLVGREEDTKSRL